MKIEAVRIEGFGKLRGIALEEIGPAITCVYGLNEAGKTTLQNCIGALLYGMKVPTHRRRDYEKEHLAFAPWEQAPYRATMVYRLDNGERFEVLRMFQRDDERVTIWDANGRDITSTFPLDPTRERAFAESHLGLTKNQFLDLCVFRQARLEEMRQGEALARKLESLVDTTSEDSTARDAITRIARALDEVGTEQATTKPLGRCAARCAELRAELARTQSKRKAVFQAAEQRKALQESLNALRERKQAKHLLQKQLEHSQAKEIVNTAKALDLDIGRLHAELATLAPYETFPADGQQPLLLAVSRQDDTEGRLHTVGKAIQNLERKIAELQRALQSRPELDTVEERDVQLAREGFAVLDNKRQVLQGEERKHEALRAEREAIESDLAGFQPLQDVLDREDWQTHLDSLEPRKQEAEALDLLRGALLIQGERLEALKRKRSYLSILSWFLLVCSALVAVAVATDLSVGKLIVLSVAVVVFILTYLAKRGVQRLEQERDSLLAEKLEELEEREQANQQRNLQCQDVLARAGASSAEELREVGRKFWDLRDKAKELALKLEMANQGKEALSHEINDLEDRVLTLLRRSGFQTASPTSQDMDAFTSLWSQKARSRQELDSSLKEQERLRGEQHKLNENLNGCKEEIRTILEQAGVKSVAEFRKACELHENHRLLKTNLESFLHKREAALRGRTLEEWEEAAHRLGEELAALRQSTSVSPAQLEAKDKDLGKLLAELATLEEEIHRHEQEIRYLEGVEKAGIGAERDVAEIEEELEECEQRLASLARRRAALGRAREILKEVSETYHTKVAQRLNKVCGELAHRITGKYSELRIEPVESDEGQFRINVRVPETGEFSPADALSRGAIDQCYFILRVGILWLLTDKREHPPLLLDDTFAHYDRKRRQEAFKFLIELASRWQLLYFTCHWHHAEEIRSLLPASKERSVGELTIITTAGA